MPSVTPVGSVVTQAIEYSNEAGAGDIG